MKSMDISSHFQDDSGDSTSLLDVDVLLLFADILGFGPHKLQYLILALASHIVASYFSKLSDIQGV